MYKLIIVEDEYEIRIGLSNYFPWAEIGFNIVGQFENGKKALEYIEKNPVDVLLSDIKMPIMTGLDLIKIIYTNKLNIKTVLISGYRDFDFAQKALKYRVKNYIVKPTIYSEVVEVFTAIKKELDEEQYTSIQPQSENIIVEENNQQGGIIKTIKCYIKQNYKDVTLEDIAKLVYMNPYYLSKFFKQKSGQNFSDYLTEIKMKKAIELMSDLSYKTYEISLMIGYKNPKNFSRAFKNYYGKSPSEYRNSGK